MWLHYAWYCKVLLRSHSINEHDEDSIIALVTELLPGYIVFGGVTFLLATLCLWSTSLRPTRYEGLRYHMEQDKVPQIALAMLLLIGACMVMLSVRTPALIIPIVVVTVAALVSALAVQAALGWWGRLQNHRNQAALVRYPRHHCRESRTRRNPHRPNRPHSPSNSRTKQSTSLRTRVRRLSRL